MWEARDKIVFIVRSEGKCTYYTEVGFEMHNIAFLLLLTDQDVMIDVSLHLESDKSSDQPGENKAYTAVLTSSKGRKVLNSE